MGNFPLTFSRTGVRAGAGPGRRTARGTGGRR